MGAASSGDTEAPIRGGALEQAEKAALSKTGGGRVTETEIGGEDSYYEVEVTLDDGSQVDVQLDKRFQVVDVMWITIAPATRMRGPKRPEVGWSKL